MVLPPAARLDDRAKIIAKDTHDGKCESCTILLTLRARVLSDDVMIDLKQYQELLVQARQHLLKTGWSHRRAAQYLERNPTHVSLVLGGHRLSLILLQRLASLPPAPLIRHEALNSKHNKIARKRQAENKASAPAGCLPCR